MYNLIIECKVRVNVKLNFGFKCQAVHSISNTVEEWMGFDFIQSKSVLGIHLQQLEMMRIRIINLQSINRWDISAYPFQ